MELENWSSLWADLLLVGMTLHARNGSQRPEHPDRGRRFRPASTVAVQSLRHER
jgi:hypothetical protein